MIHVKQLEVFYGAQRALSIRRPIDLYAGDRLAIIGSNGAGKTTLLNALLGIIPSIGDFSLGVAPEKIAVHQQSNQYASTMAVKYIMEAILGKKIEEDPMVMELIRFFHFESCLKKRFKQLSGGQQQRLTLILVLSQNAPMVFFDEVTSGLDFESRQRLVRLIVEYYEKRESTLCLISHYYEELENFANKILLLEEGEVVDFGLREELFRKYCGKTVLICANNEKNQQILHDVSRLEAPEQLIALRCQDEEEERSLADRLCRANVDYKRSGRDIEIMAFNARARWQRERNPV